MYLSAGDIVEIFKNWNDQLKGTENTTSSSLIREFSKVIEMIENGEIELIVQNPETFSGD